MYLTFIEFTEFKRFTGFVKNSTWSRKKSPYAVMDPLTQLTSRIHKAFVLFKLHLPYFTWLQVQTIPSSIARLSGISLPGLVK